MFMTTPIYVTDYSYQVRQLSHPDFLQLTQLVLLLYF